MKESSVIKKKTKRNIVVKVGSGLLTNGKGVINYGYLYSLCNQISILEKMEHTVFLVSSGAIASCPNKEWSPNMQAAFGQCGLGWQYMSIFKTFFNMNAAPILVTDADFDRAHDEYFAGYTLNNLCNEAIKERIVLIFNFNDPTSDRETKKMAKCADNDETAKNICLLPKVEIDYLILGIDMPGYVDDQGRVIPTVTIENEAEYRVFAKGGSELGFRKKGEEKGALTKYNVCCDLAFRHNLKNIIAPGRSENFILEAFNRLEKGEKKEIGTLFLPS